MNSVLKKYQQALLPVGLGLELFVLLLSYVESGADWLLFFRIAARLSGRISLLYFALFLIYSTLHSSVENESTELKSKYLLSKVFAILHVIHWFILATAITLNGFSIELVRLAPGIIAYAMIVLMPFVLSGRLLKTISLKLTQTIYVYYVWLLFFLTYLARLSGNSPTATGEVSAYILLMIITVGLLSWRIGFQLLARKPIVKKTNVR